MPTGIKQKSVLLRKNNCGELDNAIPAKIVISLSTGFLRLYKGFLGFFLESRAQQKLYLNVMEWDEGFLGIWTFGTLF